MCYGAGAGRGSLIHCASMVPQSSARCGSSMLSHQTLTSPWRHEGQHEPGVPVPSIVTADQIEPAAENFRPGLHFRIEEFATLSDGRRLVLTDDRGWGSSGPRGGGPDDLWAYETVEAIESTVRNVVLPDDAEETGEEHPGRWLA